VVNTIKVALSESCFPRGILNLSDPLELHPAILIFLVKPIGAHFFGNNLNYLLALEDDPRNLGAFEPVILHSSNVSGRLPAIRKRPSGDTVSVVNESPNLWSSAVEAKAICLEGYEAHQSVSTERKGERWRRATSARICKQVPPAAIRSTAKLAGGFWKMLTQISLPIGSVCNIQFALRCAWRPAMPIATGADIKATGTNRSNRASVIQAAQHILESNLWIMLTSLHQ
jgi:hypothetical protein